MVLGIDASRAADPQKTGVGWYCYHLLNHLKPVIPSDVRVVLYTDVSFPEALHPLPTNWEEQLLRWPPNPISRLTSHVSRLTRWPLWSQVRLAERVLRDRPDVLFVPAHVIPEVLALAPRGRRPRLVTTIHDVVFREFPNTYSVRERWYAHHATRLASRHADHIIVPTRYVAGELRRWYGVDPAKIAVVHHGVATMTTRDLRPETRDPRSGACSELISRLPSHASRLVLYVGRLERKKNVVRMVEAFNAIASEFADASFVLAGSDGHGAGDVYVAIARSPYRARIVTPGWVDAQTYHALLARAAVFCFPTLAEGFGLPILEAMAVGVPVLTSRGGAHGEVAGDAAIVVDPQDSSAIADAMRLLLQEDAPHRDERVRRGKQRAAPFTWERAAAQTWNIIVDDVLSV